MNKPKTTAPFARIAKREELTFWGKAKVRSICIGSAILLSVILLWAIGQKNPFPAIGYIFSGNFGNQYKLSQTLQETALLLGIAIALAPAYEMRFWNVGAQGQVLMGALGCSIVMIYCSALPSGVIVLLSLIVSLAFGALWALIPAFFRAKWNTNETLFTLMMNYIAIQIVSFATLNWKGANSSMGLINSASEKGWLIRLGNNDALLPLIIVAILAILMWVYLNKTKHGYELKVIGESINTARYSGIKVKGTIMRTLALSGALCGLIGFLYVAGIEHKISTDTSGGYGFTAIIVAWLAAFNPAGMASYAFLIVFLNRGALNLKNVSYAPALNEYSCELIVFVIIISIMLSEFFVRYQIHFRVFDERKAVGSHD